VNEVDIETITVCSTIPFLLAVTASDREQETTRVTAARHRSGTPHSFARRRGIGLRD